MLRLSLRRRRQLLPWLFIGPGLLWLIVFFAIPLINQLNVSLQDGDPETGLRSTGRSRRTRRDQRLPRAVPALDRLRGGGDAPRTS
jgi:ABC-type sugar transport system permease subunit